MKKRITAMLAALACFLVLLPSPAYAQGDEVIRYSDGSYTLIVTEESAHSTRALSSKTGSKQYKHYSSDKVLQWTVTLTATFTFNGTSATCTGVQEPTVTIQSGSWSVKSKTASRDANTASAKVEMKTGGLLNSKVIPVTITLSCDKNGNLT